MIIDTYFRHFTNGVENITSLIHSISTDIKRLKARSTVHIKHEIIVNGIDVDTGKKPYAIIFGDFLKVMIKFIENLKPKMI